MSAKKKASKLEVSFQASTKEKQWQKPQAAAKEMLLAIGKLAKDVAADGRKLEKVQVSLELDLSAKGTEFSGVVSEG